MSVLNVVLGVALIAVGMQESRQPLVMPTAGRFKQLPGIVAEPRCKHHEMTSPGTRQLQWRRVAGLAICIFQGVLLATGMLGHGLASRVLLILVLVGLRCGHVAIQRAGYGPSTRGFPARSATASSAGPTAPATGLMALAWYSTAWMNSCVPIVPTASELTRRSMMRSAMVSLA